MQEGFDVGLEMSGNATAFRDLLRTMHHGGSVALLGIPPGDTAIDWNQVIFKGLNMRGIYGRDFARADPGMGAGFKRWRPQELKGARRSADGTLMPLRTHRITGSIGR